MERSSEILSELKEITPGLSGGKLWVTPYSVYPDYFVDFPEILMLRIRFEASGFSDNQENTMSSVNEIEALSPILSGIRKTGTYQVPEGFFDNLTLPLPIQHKEQGRLVSMPDTGKQKGLILFRAKIFRFAAAACIAGLIGIVTFNLVNRQAITDPIKSLTSVSDQDMANFLDADDIHWTPGLFQTPETASDATASAEFSAGDIRDLMSSVPDDELEEYGSALPEEKRNIN